MTETRPRPTGPGAATQDSTIRPFQVEISQAALDDLRRRIAATRWPSPELVDDRSQGMQLATTQALARSWAGDYDWRRVAARLNALPQFLTTIDGLDLHFLHVRSPHEQALPLILTHGWPGSVIELLDTVGPSPTPLPMAAAPRTPSTWCCRRCPATASRASRPSSAGTSAASPAPGPS